MAVGYGEKGLARLDLGCGTAKCPEFIGADRLPMPRVDVIVDLNMALPFRSDSIDLLVMSHALEHVRDLLTTLREVYRICRHGAQVCVVAPYAHQALNLANPFHIQTFNEHTPRFWTDSTHTLVETSEFWHPHAPAWGLSRSDQSDPGIDFRCVSMEFFYFPEYRSLPPDRQRAARKKYLDVCDQIMYQLIVIKNGVTDMEMQDLAQRGNFYEPPDVTLRKSHERIGALEAELHAARADVAQIREEMGQIAARERAQVARACDELATTARHLDEVNAELADTRRLLAAVNEREAETGRRLEQTAEELTELRSQLETMREEKCASEIRLDDAHARLTETSHRLESTESRLALWQRHARTLNAEAAIVRDRRALRILDRFRPGPDLSKQINPTFQDLLDDSHLFLGDLKRYRLQSSGDIEGGRCLTYDLRLERPNLSGVMLAPIIDLPEETGSLGIELATRDGLVVAGARVQLSTIAEHRPVCFVFPPIPSSAQNLVLRVDVRDTATPMRLFEWRKRSFFGLGRITTRPFCAFIFQ